jgi:hypothetical protein
MDNNLLIIFMFTFLLENNAIGLLYNRLNVIEVIFGFHVFLIPFHPDNEMHRLIIVPVHGRERRSDRTCRSGYMTVFLFKKSNFNTRLFLEFSTNQNTRQSNTLG